VMLLVYLSWLLSRLVPSVCRRTRNVPCGCMLR
jgi:hypothetical protein